MQFRCATAYSRFKYAVKFIIYQRKLLLYKKDLASCETMSLRLLFTQKQKFQVYYNEEVNRKISECYGRDS